MAIQELADEYGRAFAHFKPEEFACKCGCKKHGPVLALIRLAGGMEEYRAMLCEAMGRDVPVHVNCGFRCEKHNAALGALPTSQHRFGTAADVAVSSKGIPMMTALSAALAVPSFRAGGIGIYVNIDGKGFLHLDNRFKGPARWAYLLADDGSRADLDWDDALRILARTEEAAASSADAKPEGEN